MSFPLNLQEGETWSNRLYKEWKINFKESVSADFADSAELMTFLLILLTHVFPVTSWNK